MSSIQVVAIELEELITELQVHATLGVEVPKDPSTGEVRAKTLERWAKDAAQAINRARRKTTLGEVDITVVANEQEYVLPDDVREVRKISRASSSGHVLPRDFHPQCSPPFTAGVLPSGQSVSGSLDLIRRTHLTRQTREDDWELVQGKIRFKFTTTPGEVIRVTYTKIDRSLASIPEDRFELVLTYMLWKNIDWFIGKNGSNIMATGDGLTDEGWSALYRRREELWRDWANALEQMGPEADSPASP